jgi:hypothetical protein
VVHPAADDAYELLRAQMIESATQPNASVRGLGLLLLLEHGVAAWLHAVSVCMAPSRSPSPASLRSAAPIDTSNDHGAPLPSVGAPPANLIALIPAAHQFEVATLLAALALSARPVCRHPRHPAFFTGASA